MGESANPKVTDLRDGSSATRLILRITRPNSLGEQESGPTTDQVVVEGIEGAPNGRSLGSPGDLRIRKDIPQVWQKRTGFRTRDGWVLLGAAGPVGPVGPVGPPGPVGPVGPSISTYTFSSLDFSILDGADVYFGFSAAAPIPIAGPPSSPGWTGTIGLLPQMGTAAEKFGPVSGPAGPRGVSLRMSDDSRFDVWTEVSIAGGAFVRTIQAAGLGFTAGVIAVVTFLVPNPYGPGDRLRCGLTKISGPEVFSEIVAELEIFV